MSKQNSPKSAKRKKIDKPLEPIRAGILSSDKEIQSAFEKRHQEETEKLSLLCDLYGIKHDEQMYFNLSLALCRKYEKGFKEKIKRGRKVKWDNLIKGYLVVEIERQTEEGTSVVVACENLSKTTHWSRFLESKDSSSIIGNEPHEALRQQYRSFKSNKWANVMRDAFKFHTYQGEIDKWDEELISVLEKHILK